MKEMVLVYVDKEANTVRLCTLSEKGQQFVNDEEAEDEGYWCAWSDPISPDELAEKLKATLS